MSAAPAWALGFPLEELREVSACFAEHDAGYVHGAFGAVKENRVATWRSAGWLGTYHTQPGIGCALAAEELRAERWVDDFTRERLQRIPAGGVLVHRLAFRAGLAERCAALLEEAVAGRPALVQLWQEKAEDRALAEGLGFRFLGSKVSAASEVVGLWGRGLPRPELRHGAQAATLKRIGEVPLPMLAKLRRLMQEIEPQFAQHYSSYNKSKTWTAIALKGFSDDPLFIQKPAEMAKGWRDEHPEALAEACRWTRAWPELREAVEPILALMPCTDFERVRFMRLAPGGELTRHADITNRDAGIEDGRLARLHVPVETNPGAIFTMIDLEGRELREHMAEGELWYLDQRKPHACVNGPHTRTHLVVDAVCNWRTRLALI